MSQENWKTNPGSDQSVTWTWDTQDRIKANYKSNELYSTGSCSFAYVFESFFFFFAQNLDKQQPLAEGLFKYVMMLPPAYEKAVNSEDFDR